MADWFDENQPGVTFYGDPGGDVLANLRDQGIPYNVAPASDYSGDGGQSSDRGFLSEAEARQKAEALSNQYGVPLGETDIANLQGKAREDQAAYLAALGTQLQQRATNVPNQSRYVDSRTVAPSRAGSTGGGASSLSGFDFGGMPSGFGAGGVYYPPTYASNPNAPAPPALMTPYVAPTWTGGDFVEPTMAQVEASPGYQTRLDTGRQARERSAAAQGTVLSGGTQKALERYGQDYGTGEYQTYRTNAFQDYLTKYGQFVDKGNAEFGARQQNLAEGQTDYQNRYGAYNNENLRTLTDFTTNTAAQRGASQDYWDRLIGLYNGGRATAGGSYQAPAG